MGARADRSNPWTSLDRIALLFFALIYALVDLLERV